MRRLIFFAPSAARATLQRLRAPESVDAQYFCYTSNEHQNNCSLDPRAPPYCLVLDPGQ